MAALSRNAISRRKLRDVKNHGIQDRPPFGRRLNAAIMHSSKACDDVPRTYAYSADNILRRYIRSKSTGQCS